MKISIILILTLASTGCTDQERGNIDLDSQFQQMEEQIDLELKEIKEHSSSIEVNTPVADKKKQDSKITEAMERISSRSNDEDIDSIDTSDCDDYVAMWGAEDVAKSTGMNKKDVFFNYRFSIWDSEPSISKNNVIGELHVQSYARIIEKTENDYLIESPKGVVGWISADDVKGTAKMKKVDNRPRYCE